MLVGLVPAAASPTPATSPGEGFSASRRGLPAAARDAWSATVMVVRFEGKLDGADELHPPHSGWGSGVIVTLDEPRRSRTIRSAIIATTSHVVRCGRPPCRYAVGFTDPKGSEARYWTMQTSLEESSAGTDLAFLAVEVPPQVSPSVPTLADPACHGDDLAPTITVGWPNLALRTAWGVRPPSNPELLLKRFSTGRRVQYIGSYPLNNFAVDRRERVPIIFHNADLLPGSSGGPLLDRDGRVVGINSRIFVPGDRSEKFDYCARPADLHRPGEDCINMAISSRAIVEAYRNVFGGRLPLEACGANESEPSLQAAEVGQEDAAPEILTESAHR